MLETRSSGVLLHPTSLPSAFGCGDFGPSAYQFVDFLEEAGQSFWQVLPFGPTSFGDSPYQSFSAFAGNPLFISPELLLQADLLTQEECRENQCGYTSSVNYELALCTKEKLFQTAFERFQNKTKKEKQDFQRFCKDKEAWLTDYCLFVCIKQFLMKERETVLSSPELQQFETSVKDHLEENVIKDYFYGAVWNSWPEELKKRRPNTLLLWTKKLSKEIEYQQFLQYLFFRQWEALKQYANQKGIQIIGDIPIFVAFDSADCWTAQEEFAFDGQGIPEAVAGVPPDYFSPTGQLWGNPLYDWDRQAKTGYAFWTARLKNMSAMFDRIRIDHFRGFDSYWAIPYGEKDATGGKWMPGPGEAVFLKIQKELGELQIIAEDLGIITDGVRRLRDKLGFPGMRVLQFAFDGNPQNDHLPYNYDKNTVVYTGTHDNDTTCGWYKKASAAEQDQFRRYLNSDGSRPSWDLIRLAASSTANLAIYPMQDILSLGSDARMNTPSTPSGNWHFQLQDIDFSTAAELKYITSLFGRLPKNEKDKND